MQVQINDDYRITTDAYCVTVEKKFTAKEGKRAGESYWKPQSYHNTLPQACRWLVNHEVNIHQGSDIESLCTALNGLYEQIEEAFAGVGV